MSSGLQPLRAGPTPWASDALWPGVALRDRLRTEVPELRQVELSDDLMGDATDLTLMPGALVLLANWAPAQSNQPSRVVQVVQDWWVVLCIDPAARQAAAAHTEAGPLLSAVVKAGHGYSPREGAGGLSMPFGWTSGPRPRPGRPYLFPVAFRITVPTN